jgi:glycosyltransferase involved in cell wall biosynthesis
MITYNHEKFINKAIEGVLSQNCDFNFEFIISDDFSSDDTSILILDRIKDNNGKVPIKFFPQKTNKGIINNFVFALKQCTGKYIAICEGDDYWIDNKKLSKQTDLLEKDNNLVGSFHFVKVEYEGKPYLSNLFMPNVPEIIGTEDLISTSSLIHTSSLFFRRTALVFPDWYTTMLSGDFALTSILSKKGSFKRVNDIMSVYRVHNQGVTNSKVYNKENKILKINILEKLNVFHENKYDEKFKKVITQLNNENLNSSFLKKIRKKIRIGLIIKRLKFWVSRF